MYEASHHHDPEAEQTITVGEPVSPEQFAAEIKAIQHRIIEVGGPFVPNKMSANVVIPLFKGGEPVGFGFLFFEKEYAELMRIVDPTEQSQGLGARLLTELETYARQQGCTELRSYIVANKPSAQAALEKAGYSVLRHDGDRILYHKTL